MMVQKLDKRKHERWCDENRGKEGRSLILQSDNREILRC